jgi:hypothetical protein
MPAQELTALAGWHLCDALDCDTLCSGLSLAAAFEAPAPGAAPMGFVAPEEFAAAF